MPQGMIASSGTTPRGQRETLARYLCDWPGCENVAEHVVNVVRDIGLFAAVCKEHAPLSVPGRAAAGCTNEPLIEPRA